MVELGGAAVVRHRDRGSRALERHDDLGSARRTAHHKTCRRPATGSGGLRRRRRADGAAGQSRARRRRRGGAARLRRRRHQHHARRRPAAFEPIEETTRYTEFSGDQIDQALLTHVLENLAGGVDPAGTAAVGSLARLREECRRAKERLSAETALNSSPRCRAIGPNPGHPRRTGGSDLRPLDGVLAALDALPSATGLRRPALPRLRPSAAARAFPLSLSGCPSTPGAGGDDTAARARRRRRRGAVRRLRRGCRSPHRSNAATALDADAPTGAAAAATDRRRPNPSTTDRPRRARVGDVPRACLVAGGDRRRPRSVHR